LTTVEEEAAYDKLTDINSLVNYNPTNGQLRLRVTLNRRMIVEIRAYDILGREVATIYPRELDAGSTDIVIDASSWSSGVYLLMMRTQQKFIIQKATVVH
jgi:hypothetical protein